MFVRVSGSGLRCPRLSRRALPPQTRGLLSVAAHCFLRGPFLSIVNLDYGVMDRVLLTVTLAEGSR